MITSYCRQYLIVVVIFFVGHNTLGSQKKQYPTTQNSKTIQLAIKKISSQYVKRRQKKKTHLKIILIVGFIVLVIVGVLLYYFLYYTKETILPPIPENPVVNIVNQFDYWDIPRGDLTEEQMQEEFEELKEERLEQLRGLTAFYIGYSLPENEQGDALSNWSKKAEEWIQEYGGVKEYLKKIFPEHPEMAAGFYQT